MNYHLVSCGKSFFDFFDDVNWIRAGFSIIYIIESIGYFLEKVFPCHGRQVDQTVGDDLGIDVVAVLQLPLQQGSGSTVVIGMIKIDQCVADLIRLNVQLVV